MFDDDHYYMGGVIAELLAKEGLDVTLITPRPTSRSGPPTPWRSRVSANA